MSADDSFKEARARARVRNGLLTDASPAGADEHRPIAFDNRTPPASGPHPLPDEPDLLDGGSPAADPTPHPLEAQRAALEGEQRPSGAGAPAPNPSHRRVSAESARRAIEEIGLLAAAVAQTPMSALAVIRDSAFTSEVSVGMTGPSPVVDELCGEVASHGAQLVIDDLHADPRLRDLLGGTRSHDLRFFAGMPLIGSEGEILGVLSVMDNRKRHLDGLQEELLGALARMASALLDPARAKSSAAPGPALLAASARLKGLLEHADAMIYIRNEQGRFVLANRAVERMLGRENGGMLGALASDLLPAEIAAEHLANDAKVLAEGASMVFEERAPHPDGTLHDFVSTKFALPDFEGRMSLVGGISFDVTERNRARVELAAAERGRRDSEQRFALAFDEAPSGMAIVGLRGPDAGRFLRVNRALCQITGYSEEDLVGTSVHAIGHPEDRRSATRALARLASGEQQRWEVERRYRHAAGHELWVHMSAFVAADVDWANAYAIAHIQDITARKHGVAWLSDPSPSATLLRGVDAVMSRAQR